MSRIRIPTLLAQGEADTSVLAAEAVATYEALRAQDTPVKMIWQSWGHSNETPAPGELGKLAGGYAIYDSAGHLTYEGETVLQWFGHYVRNGRPGQPAIGREQRHGDVRDHRGRGAHQLQRDLRRRVQRGARPGALRRARQLCRVPNRAGDDLHLAVGAGRAASAGRRHRFLRPRGLRPRPRHVGHARLSAGASVLVTGAARGIGAATVRRRCGAWPAPVGTSWRASAIRRTLSPHRRVSQDDPAARRRPTGWRRRSNRRSPLGARGPGTSSAAAPGCR
jgi:hypothetical protein